MAPLSNMDTVQYCKQNFNPTVKELGYGVAGRDAVRARRASGEAG